MWSDVNYVELHRGHLHGVHHNKIGATSEFSGITVRNLGSMCATDQWHDDKGYVGNIKEHMVLYGAKTTVYKQSFTITFQWNKKREHYAPLSS